MKCVGRSPSSWDRWLVVLVAGLVAQGCRHEEPAPSAPGKVFSVGRSVDQFVDLPVCTPLLAGTTASVASPPGLWTCAGDWAPIACTNLLAGSVAYASDSATFWACLSGVWTQVSHPAADAGVPAPSLIAVTPEPVGAHCPAGGQRIDVGGDDDGNGVLDPGEVDSTAYVCNGESGPPAPSTIYQVKEGVVPAGSGASLPHVLVTAVQAGQGFFVQVKETDTGYTGADHSGLFVFAPTATVSPGDRVDLRGTVASFFGEVGLVASTVAVTSSGEALPAVDVVAPAQLVLQAAGLDGVLVEVDSVTVSATDAMTGAFVVDSGVRVGSDLFSFTLPPLGQGFSKIQGVLVLRDSGATIEPRSAADLVFGGAELADFSPALTSVAVGALATVTGPTPLTVRLSTTTPVDAFVAVTSSNPTALTVEGGGVTIPAGQDSAPVLVNGLVASAGVVLTASWSGTMMTASVRVVGPTDSSRVASLTPTSVMVAPGATQTFTVTLDLAAGPGGEIVLISVGPSFAGSAPPAVLLLEGQSSATFDFVAGTTPLTATVVARLRASIKAATVTIGP